LTATTAALVAVFFIAYGVQTATGFGAALVSVTLGAQLAPVTDVVLLVLALSLGQCGYIALRYRGSIDWSFLVRWVVPVMGAGAAAGAYLAGHLDGGLLRRILGGLILALSVIELAASVRRKATPARPISAPVTAVGLVGAGLMHGAYAIGGPPLVYVMVRRGFDKATFRTTITVIWLGLNVALVAYHGAVGRYTPELLGTMALLVPAVIGGVIAGEIFFRRIDGPRFMQAVFALLAVAALGLLLR
jgi:hypothetical protein